MQKNFWKILDLDDFSELSKHIWHLKKIFKYDIYWGNSLVNITFKTI